MGSVESKRIQKQNQTILKQSVNLAPIGLLQPSKIDNRSASIRITFCSRSSTLLPAQPRLKTSAKPHFQSTSQLNQQDPHFLKKDSHLTTNFNQPNQRIDEEINFAQRGKNMQQKDEMMTFEKQYQKYCNYIQRIQCPARLTIQQKSFEGKEQAQGDQVRAKQLLSVSNVQLQSEIKLQSGQGQINNASESECKSLKKGLSKTKDQRKNESYLQSQSQSLAEKGNVQVKRTTKKTTKKNKFVEKEQVCRYVLKKNPTKPQQNNNQLTPKPKCKQQQIKPKVVQQLTKQQQIKWQSMRSKPQQTKQTVPPTVIQQTKTLFEEGKKTIVQKVPPPPLVRHQNKYRQKTGQSNKKGQRKPKQSKNCKERSLFVPKGSKPSEGQPVQVKRPFKSKKISDQFDQFNQQLAQLKTTAVEVLLDLLERGKINKKMLPHCRDYYSSQHELKQTFLPLVVIEQYQAIRQQQSQKKFYQYKVQLARSEGAEISINIMNQYQQQQLSYKLLSGDYICTLKADKTKYYCLLKSQLDPKTNVSTFRLSFLNHKDIGSEQGSIRLLDPIVTYERRFIATQALSFSPLLPYILRPMPRQTGPGEYQPDIGSLNRYQAEVVVQGLQLQKGVMVVQGPPGTGKTTTICQLIRNFLGRGQKVLVATGSNQAVNNIAMKFVRQAKQMRESVIRFGLVTQRQLLPYGFAYLVEAAVMKQLKVAVESVSEEQFALFFEENFKGSADRDIRKTIASALLEDQIARIETLLTFNEKQARYYQNRLRMLRRVRLFNARVSKRYLRSHDKEQLYAEILDNRSAVFTTTASCGQQSLLKNFYGQFAAVIVDEASQIVDPDLFIPLMTGGARLVLVGDQKQLEPTVLSPMAKARGFGLACFQRFVNASAEPYLQLSIQFRMHPQISFYPNQQFYNGRLIDQPKPPKHNFFNRKIVFINVEGKEQTSGFNSSIYNMDEVEVVSKLVSKLRARKAEVGVVSGYKEQVKRLKEEIYKRLQFIDSVKISTVDGFQGNQREVIVVSCVRASASGKIGFLSDKRRLNVALTRAQHQLILVGHVQFLGLKDQTWGQLIEYCRKLGSVYQVKQVNFDHSIQSFSNKTKV